MNKAEIFLESIKPQIIKAFSDLPDFGKLSFTIHVNESMPVRFEHSYSESIKLEKKSVRGVEK